MNQPARSFEASQDKQAQSEKGFSQVILLGVVAVFILAGAGGFVVLRGKKTPSFKKTSLQVPSEIIQEPARNEIMKESGSTVPPATIKKSTTVSKPSVAPTLLIKEIPPPQQDERYGMRIPFYTDGRISFEYYWPKDEINPYISAEETEMLVFNESAENMEVRKITFAFRLEGTSYPISSGTWEKFPSRQSWERIQYINIGQGSYTGTPLILEPGEKGKIHYHISFGSAFSPQKFQQAEIIIQYVVNGTSKTLEKTVVRKVQTATAPPSNCVSNLSPVFTNHITDMSKVNYIVPPPTMGAGPSLKPHSYIGTDHVRVPIYAPTAITLKSGSHNVGGPYMFEFQVSCEVTIRFGHMTEPVTAIKQLLPAEPKADSRTQELPPVAFAAGELIGYTTGTDIGGNWDFGVYNSATQNRYVNDPDWNTSATYTTAVCPFDYFVPALKAEYTMRSNSNALGGNPPHGESFCL